jgi:replication-associated recombination protein RarA
VALVLVVDAVRATTPRALALVRSGDRKVRLDALCATAIPKAASGDVRFALNLLENLSACQTLEEEEELLKNLHRAYTDKGHYDYASAMIKSMIN